VCGEDIEYAGLDGAFLAHCQLRRLRESLWNQSLDAKVYLKPPGSARKKSQFLKQFQLAVHKAQEA
jgi:hypothetical protein